MNQYMYQATCIVAPEDAHDISFLNAMDPSLYHNLCNAAYPGLQTKIYDILPRHSMYAIFAYIGVVPGVK